ncbi:protein PIN-LIKES 3-like isoform X1 [Pistacia vera]|uniref:protein PIN-LIKES 3-like isoform X1 n=2 Tax=Pistacia vera TaxID=55513 RepID=UPI0012639E2B|nr:protein PIN-LIKES 3-like isoform X1 [Pistacia vera]XP_031269283.1 protein PIN-LIKES 3-like isoform X1 [Pistacia vera]XP_031269284.1 protein PIN-LIKES 3-like isoform X1 [Pistacia vera]
MGFLDLLIAALEPVVEVLLVTAVGLLLAIDRIDLLGPNARRSLNHIVFYVFNPALIVANLSDTITFTSLVKLWFMPVNILLTFIIGSALAWILIKITRTPPHLQSLVIGCCSAGNLGNLLLIIVPAVCEESNSPFGDSSTCSTNGEAYASLSMAVGSIYIWTYVYVLMSLNVKDSTTSIKSSGETSEMFSETCTEALLPSDDGSTSDDSANQDELPHTIFGVPFLDTTIHRIKNVTAKIKLKMVFAPSTIAAAVGFIIGTVSPIRKLIIGDSAPLRVIYSSASLLGEASIPSVTLIIGANLLGGLQRSGISFSVIIGIIAVRFIFLPLLGVVVVKAAHHFGMVGSDSLYQFILLLQFSLPPGVAVGTITQLFQTSVSECSVIMLWTYAVASLAITLWTTFYMWLLS